MTAVALEGRDLLVDRVPAAPGRLVASAVGPRVHIAGRTHRGIPRIQATGPVRVDGRAFPGEVALVPLGDGRLDVINHVPLELYVARSVAGEVYATWPAEALRAQAVVARTYALHQRERRALEPYDLESGVLSQVYATRPVPAAVRDAVAATRGQILTHRGAPILAAFHASAGGRTAAADEVWAEAIPYLQRVESPDEEAPDHFWRFEIPLDDLHAALGEAGYAGTGDDIQLIERSPSGRVSRLRVGTIELSGRDLRRVLGGRAIRSALFEVRREGEWVRFLGSGAGHGVGLSQWGALELARRGLRYAEILEHYYPGTRLHRPPAAPHRPDRSASP